MAAGKDGLGIETDCIAAIPSYDKPAEDEQIVYIN